jgi:hypothetical protein
MDIDRIAKPEESSCDDPVYLEQVRLSLEKRGLKLL